LESNLKQGISYLEIERGGGGRETEIEGRDREIEGRDIETEKKETELTIKIPSKAG
jgi:hypothetical protein